MRSVILHWTGTCLSALAPRMVVLSKLPLHAARYAHQKLNPLLFETLNVNEYPKSGGTWVCRMLRDATGWRFDDNAVPRYGSSIVKYHRIPLDVGRQAVIVRDPRDVFVSLFFHSRAIFRDDPFNSAIVQMTRSIFEDHADEQGQMQVFIERLLSDPIYPRFAWHEFYHHQLDKGLPIFRYEDFREAPAETLAQLLRAVDIAVDPARLGEVAESHSIEKILDRRAAEQPADQANGNFIRRGKVGGFRDHLTPELISRIETAEGEIMARFGYL